MPGDRLSKPKIWYSVSSTHFNFCNWLYNVACMDSMQMRPVPNNSKKNEAYNVGQDTEGLSVPVI